MKNIPETDVETWTGKILHGLGVRHVEVRFSGGGDSGDLDEVRYFSDAEGTVEMSQDALEQSIKKITMPSDFRHTTMLDILHSYWEGHANDQGNWYDNSGGAVESAYSITAEGTDHEFSHITYYDDENDEEEEYDEELEEDADFDLEEDELSADATQENEQCVEPEFD